MQSQDVLFVGHRGTGKTSIAEALSLRGRDVVDLDRRIEQAEGKSCEELVAEDETRFRELERSHLTEVLRRPSARPRIIVPGAGFHPIPPEPLCIWIYRDDWEKTAVDQRKALRPDKPIAQELEWMRQTREPRWARAAHLKVDIPRGRTPDRVVDQIETWIDWSSRVGGGALAARTWLVPSEPEEWTRTTIDCARWELAGAEVRSDLFDAPIPGEDTKILASLRTPSPEWLLQWPNASVIDVDLRYLQDVHRAGIWNELTPRPLLLSLHPARVEPDDVTEIVTSIRELQQEYPAWAGSLTVKYAPQIDSWFDLGAALALMRPLKRAGLGVTCLPQGFDWAWTRPILAGSMNRTNYLPVGLSGRRRGWGEFRQAPPYDLQDWLPHLVAPVPVRFDALIGQPAHPSRGDVWHRERSLAEEEGRFGYVKIPVEPSDVDHALAQFQQLDLRGVSVTSPLKRVVPRAELVEAEATLSAANTLRNAGDRWVATDTDAVGMTAALREIEDAGVGPGSAAIFGRGGVSPAVRASLEASGWTVVVHASAREGWPRDRPERVDLVINAAGNFNEPHHGAPRCAAWLDLHYNNVRPAPEGALHFIGDAFFEAQAAAQRRFWSQR